MRPKIGKKTTMPNMIAMSQEAARGLVDRERRATGSKMIAYENVARAVGSTPEWIRKFVKNNEGKEPGLSVGFKILDLYNRVCLRVERATEKELTLKGEIDAAFESIALILESEARAEELRQQS